MADTALRALRAVREALDLDGESREAMLEELSRTDPRLHEAVVGQLGAAGSESFLDRPIPTGEGGLPERVGMYRVIQRLGAGGMGEVLLGVREIDGGEQRVAIKLVKRGMDTDEILRRFETERRTLATLNHPYIAGLLDAGAAADGRPFLVMEYIEGEPIDRYCDGRRLSIADRLTLFRRVCAAVQHAHQHLVVHRDLKPGNILVTHDGVPKLLDFGIAKLLDTDESSQTRMTRLGSRPLTPDYASPEQVRGEPTGTAADVYSLGVVLYELLTGSRPHRLKTGSTAEIERVVCETTPTRPSASISDEDAAAVRRATQERLRRVLRGDLDTVVLKALQKDHRLRYQSALELSADLEAIESHRPIRARQPSAAYLAATFVRRNRVLVGTACTIGATLLLAVVAILLSLQQTRSARDDAEFAAANAERINAVLRSTLALANPTMSPDSQMTVREALDVAAAEAEGALGDEPAVIGPIRNSIGMTYRDLGMFERAEDYVARSLADLTAAYGPEHRSTLSARTDLALIYHDLGRLIEAERALSAALEDQRRVLGRLDDLTLRSMNNLGWLLITADPERSERVIREAYELQVRAGGEDHPMALKLLANHAMVLTNLERLDEAEPRARECVAAHERVFGVEHPNTLYPRSVLAWALEQRGRVEEAAEELGRTVEVARRELGPEHPNTLYWSVSLARCLSKLGRYDAAEPVLRRAIEARVARGEDGFVETAIARHTLGEVLRQRGQLGEAERLTLRAYEVFRERLGEEHVDTVGAAETLADLYEAVGRPEDAARYRASARGSG